VRIQAFAALCAIISGPAIAGVVYEVDLVNMAPSTIVSMEVARAGSERFHRAAFVKTPIVGGGESATVIVREGDGCLRDLRIALADGSIVTRTSLDICRDLRDEASGIGSHRR